MVGFPPISHPKCWSFLVGKPHGLVGETHHFRKPRCTANWVIIYITYIPPIKGTEETAMDQPDFPSLEREQWYTVDGRNLTQVDMENIPCSIWLHIYTLRILAHLVVKWWGLGCFSSPKRNEPVSVFGFHDTFLSFGEPGSLGIEST